MTEYDAKGSSIKLTELGPRATQECAYEKRCPIVMGQKVNTR